MPGFEKTPSTTPNTNKSGPVSGDTEVANVHWADHAAEELIQRHPGHEQFVCASGISPSGVVHIGNFREVITVEFVARSLKERGKKVRFIYSWDDYDALRKVPPNIPNQALVEANLRKSLAQIPDPHGESDSYAGYLEGMFEKSLKQVEISPEYLRQNQAYRRGDYADGIRTALEHEKEIIAILNKYRTEPLEADWTCVTVFCKECLRDTTKVKKYTAPSTIDYTCKACKKDFSVDFTQKESGVKLLWRVDWPMRWARENVDFEPGGKDHSSPGGSFETGCEIARQVWKQEPPYYVRYDFVIAKGLGGKMSSSKGQLITLDEALAIYEPAVLRWIFASRKPNLDFAIAFDLDVIKAYDDFDRTMCIARKEEPADEKKQRYEQRIYELSRTSHYPPVDEGQINYFGFRHLCNILQIYQGSLEDTKAYFGSLTEDPADEKRFMLRARCAWNWIEKYAPEDFRFKLREVNAPKVQAKLPEVVKAVIDLLESPEFETMAESDLSTKIFDAAKSRGVEPKALFQDVYTILIGKQNGPKLASFLKILGKDKAARILRTGL